MSTAGKGDRYRPIPPGTWVRRYDRIDWGDQEEEATSPDRAGSPPEAEDPDGEPQEVGP